MTTTHDIRPFTLHVPEASLRELRTRLRQTRWPVEEAGTGWDHGVPVDYAKDLAAYWAEGFDWRAQEHRINAFPQFTTPIDGHDMHFFHIRSEHEGAGRVVGAPSRRRPPRRWRSPRCRTTSAPRCHARSRPSTTSSGGRS